MSGNLKKKSKGALRAYVVELLDSPYDQHVGTKFTMLGNWWPNCKPADKYAVFKMMIVEFVPAWLPAACSSDTKGKPMFKVKINNSS